MAQRLEVDCIKQTDVNSERITGIGGPNYNGNRWTFSAQDAIKAIDSKTYEFYVRWRSSVTDIHVANGPNGQYLRTDRDSTTRNNLLDLRSC